MECAMLKQAGLRGRTACYTKSVGSIQRSSQDWGYLGAIGVLARARPSLEPANHGAVVGLEHS